MLCQTKEQNQGGNDDHSSADADEAAEHPCGKSEQNQ
jgi:hypothetical protein